MSNYQDIRNILNRIDGVNAPVQEKSDNSDIDIRKLLVDISAMKDRIAELAISDDAKTSAFTALGQVEEDIAQEIEGPYPEGESVVQEATTDRKLLAMVDNLRDEIMEHPRMPNDTKTEVFTSLEEIEQAIHMMNDGQDPATSIQPELPPATPLPKK